MIHHINQTIVVGSLRIGGTRERQEAILELEKLLDYYALSNKL